MCDKKKAHTNDHKWSLNKITNVRIRIGKRTNKRTKEEQYKNQKCDQSKAQMNKCMNQNCVKRTKMFKKNKLMHNQKNKININV